MMSRTAQYQEFTRNAQLLTNYAVQLMGPVATSNRDPRWHQAMTRASQAYVHFYNGMSSSAYILGYGEMVLLRNDLAHLPGYASEPIVRVNKIIDLIQNAFVEYQMGERHHEYSLTLSARIQEMEDFVNEYIYPNPDIYTAPSLPSELTEEG